MSKKESKNEIKELMKTPRGRAILFFGAYLLFFLFIAIFARTGGTSNINKKYESGSPLDFSLNGIEKSNYKFKYEVNIDGVISKYEGSSTFNNSLFKVNDTKEYYFNGKNYFTNNNGVWLNVENPLKSYDFINNKNIGKYIEKATYISKTEYDSGKDVYTFNISSATINKILFNKDLDISEVPNEIIISTNDENNVNEVKYVLDSYCKVKKLCTNSMKITLNYDDIGNVSDIASPLE